MATKTDAAQAELTGIDLELAVQAAKGWNPSEGDTVMGKIIKIGSSNPNRYGIYPIVTVLTDDGELVNLHCFHSVLKNRLIAYRPTVGERLAVKYVGEQQGKNFDEPYHNYAVVMDRGEDSNQDAFDWSSVADTTAVE